MNYDFNHLIFLDWGWGYKKITKTSLKINIYKEKKIPKNYKKKIF